MLTDQFNFQIYTHTRHQGIPFYPSLDTYTLLVSMVQIPGYYYTFFDSQFRSLIWDRLWLTSREADEMKAKVTTAINGNLPRSIETTLDLLRGVRLKCGVTQVLFKVLFENTSSNRRN